VQLLWNRGNCGYSEVDEYDISRLERDEILSEKVRCSSKMTPRLRAERVLLSEELCILACCFLSPKSRNSVLEELEFKGLQSSRKICVEENFVGE